MTKESALRNRRALILAAALIAAAALMAGCSGKQVHRVETDAVIDLSGNWNDTDSRLVAEELISQAVARPWAEDYLERNGRRPTVIVGQIRNRSAEHIPVGTFMGDMERSFINSGRVKVVASSEERDQLRAERADQQEFASEETMKQWGRERGADFMMLGEINTIIDREEGDEVKFYQVDVYLVDLQDNTKAWAGFKKIKKYVTRSGYRP